MHKKSVDCACINRCILSWPQIAGSADTVALSWVSPADQGSPITRFVLEVAEPGEASEFRIAYSGPRCAQRQRHILRHRKLGSLNGLKRVKGADAPRASQRARRVLQRAGS